jgi:hypothetical protein
MLIEYRDHIVPRVLGRKPDRLFEWLSLDDADAGSQTVHGKIHRIGWLR